MSLKTAISVLDAFNDILGQKKMAAFSDKVCTFGFRDSPDLLIFFKNMYWCGGRPPGSAHYVVERRHFFLPTMSLKASTFFFWGDLFFRK
jgi:hypothetical protein